MEKPALLFLAALVLILAVSGCDAGKGPTPTATVLPTATPQPVEPTEHPPTALPATLEIFSTAFADGEAIPAEYSCDGENVSPPLAWGEPPEGTQSFALICDDPDAPAGVWVHWVLYNIPGEARGLAEAIPAEGELAIGGVHGKNSWGRMGYGGPCPPSGTHRYFFKLYALDAMLDLPAGVDKDQLIQAMEGHVLGQAELMGTYAR